MYVPACDERKVMKTTTISVDSIIFDIEDGVAVNQKVYKCSALHSIGHLVVPHATDVTAINIKFNPFPPFRMLRGSLSVLP